MNDFFASGILRRVHNSFWVFLSKLLIFVLELAFRSRVDEKYANGEPSSENGNDDQSEEEISVSNKYEFFHSNGGVSGFLQVPEVESFTVQEFYLESDESGRLREEGFSERFVFEKVSGDEDNRGREILTGGRETEDFYFTVDERLEQLEDATGEKTKDSVSVETEESDSEKEEDLNFIVENRLGKVEQEADENTENPVSVDSEKNYLEEEEDFSFIVEKRWEKLVEEADEKTEESVSSVSVETEKNDSEKEEILNFIIEKRLEKLAEEADEETEDSVLAGLIGSEALLVPNNNTVKLDPESPKLVNEAKSADPMTNLIDDFDEEFIEMEPQFWNLNLESNDAGESLGVLGNSLVSIPSEQVPIRDSAEEDDSDSEEDDIIERLKMEIRNARTGGLPTILEESESPKMVQEFKPFMFDEKLDHIADINKVFKTYLERMKKLDILNCQTMHAIGLLQLKGPDQSDATKKSSALPLKNLWPFRQRKADDATDSRKKYMRDLQKDLETVYAGQICLSWEILNWQYDKALKLLESDHQRSKQYNQVAGEFQLFQVLLQRFLEDEPFQNVPRVKNYVKNRFVLRKFLQVPSLKDDRSKDQNGNGYLEENNAVSIEDLADIMEESMHMFWEFLRADKDEVNVSSKTSQVTQVAPQDPADSEILIEIRTDFQKKERKLKQMLRCSSCILKKFQKQQQQQQQPRSLPNHAYLVAQAELKLVSRVLNMSEISADQIIWCQEKLEKLRFCSRKIEIEPSCLLFPC